MSNESISKLAMSQDHVTSKYVDERIRHLGEAIKRAQRNNFGALRTPIIAGGAVRDFAHGTYPRDYDVFLDISKIPAEEQEDTVLLFALAVIEELTKDDESKYLLLRDTVFQTVTKEYGENHIAIDPRWKDFFVWETGPQNEYYTAEWRRKAAEEGFGAANDQYRYLPIQFIGHNDSRLSEENPLAFVEYFDYDLVKCLYDPETESYDFHPDFLKTVESKTLTVDNERSERRASNFVAKLGHSYRADGSRLKTLYNIIGPKKRGEE